MNSDLFDFSDLQLNFSRLLHRSIAAIHCRDQLQQSIPDHLNRRIRLTSSASIDRHNILLIMVCDQLLIQPRIGNIFNSDISNNHIKAGTPLP